MSKDTLWYSDRSGFILSKEDASERSQGILYRKKCNYKNENTSYVLGVMRQTDFNVIICYLQLTQGFILPRLTDIIGILCSLYENTFIHISEAARSGGVTYNTFGLKGRNNRLGFELVLFKLVTSSNTALIWTENTDELRSLNSLLLITFHQLLLEYDNLRRRQIFYHYCKKKNTHFPCK